MVRERARRRARIEHDRQKRLGRRRFLVLLLFLLFVACILALTIWDQVQALFGL
jgi:hypothetical protein